MQAIAGVHLRVGARFFVALTLIVTPMRKEIWPAGLLMFAAGLGLVAACTSPLGDIGFDESERPRYALPLLATTFTLEDALQGFDFIGALRDDDGLRLVREDTIFSDRVLKSVVLDDIAAPLPDTNNTVSLRDFGFDIPVSKVGLRRANFNYALSSGSDEALEVELRVPNLTDRNGDTLVVRETIAPNGAVTGGRPVNGFTISLNPAADFTINYTARTPSGEAAELALAVVQLSEMEANFVEGSLDSFPYLLGANTLITDYLTTFEPNSASVLDARVTVEITNTAAVPLRFDGLGSYAALRDGGRFPFNSSLAGGVPLDFPAVSGDTARTRFTLDDSNSSLLAAVRQFPDSLVFDLQAVVNPDRLDETFRVNYLDRVIGAFIFDIPLAVDFDGFTVEEDFSFGAVDQLDSLSEATLVLASRNSVGLAASGQVYLLDQDSTVLDSLFERPELLVDAATVGADSEIVGANDYVARIPLSRVQLAQIRRSPLARIALRLDTPDDDGSDFAQLRYTDELDLRVGLDFTLQ